ncbi:hypothetical protein GGF50DRAFT_52658 [Schizophyllum commune]
MSRAGDLRYARTPISHSKWTAAPERLTQALSTKLGKVRFLRRLSYTLHGYLFFLHIVLFAVCYHHLEEGLTIPLSGDGNFDNLTSTVITVSGTVFATLYGALLIWLTQRLALRRLLTSEQTLTAMHDEFKSWIGIGSALLALFGQSRIKSALPWVLCIAGYLVNVTVLHITMPAMFSLQVGNLYHPDNITTQMAYPDVYNMLHTWPTDARDTSTLLHALFSDASSLLPYVLLLDPDKTVGLAKATIYDQLATNTLSDTIALVNATTFDVSCGTLHSLEVDDTYPKSAPMWYSVSHVYPNGTKQEDIRVKYIQPNNAMALTWHNITSDDIRPGANRSFYLYGTFDIEDSAGDVLSNFSLPEPNGHPPNVSMIGCDLHSYNHTIQVDTTTRVAKLDQVPALRKSALWSDWEPQDPVAPDDLAILDLWITAVMKQYQTSFTLGGTGVYRLGFMEKFIASYLGLQLPGWSATHVPRGQVMLHHVENALSELAAAYFWSLNQVNTDNQYGIERTSDIAIGRPEAVRRLHLNRTPVVVGLCASTLLMIMNLLLVRPRRTRAIGAVDVLDTLGLLQIVWFVRGRPDALSTVGRVQRPNEQDLRHAGMFVVPPDVRTVPDARIPSDVSAPPDIRSPPNIWNPNPGGGERIVSLASTVSSSATLVNERLQTEEADDEKLHKSAPSNWETFDDGYVYFPPPDDCKGSSSC